MSNYATATHFQPLYLVPAERSAVPAPTAPAGLQTLSLDELDQIAGAFDWSAAGKATLGGTVAGAAGGAVAGGIGGSFAGGVGALPGAGIGALAGGAGGAVSGFVSNAGSQFGWW